MFYNSFAKIGNRDFDRYRMVGCHAPQTKALIKEIFMTTDDFITNRFGERNVILKLQIYTRRTEEMIIFHV